MLTRIGKYPRASITRYSVLCEGMDRDQGIVIVPVAYTSNMELAQDIAKKLNGQLMEDIYDTSRVMEFFVEEEEISQNTEVDEEMLREFLSPSIHPDYTEPNPIKELMKYIYDKEVPNESLNS